MTFTTLVRRLSIFFVLLSTVISCIDSNQSYREGSIIYGEVIKQNPVTKKYITTNLTLEMKYPNSNDPSVGPGPYPVILFIHGGFWIQGNWIDFENEMEDVAKRGYVAASINYRLLTPNPLISAKSQLNEWPAAIQDANCAVRWLHANAHRYNISTEMDDAGKEQALIGVVGHSAGATSALLLALAENKSEFIGDCTSNGQDTRSYVAHIQSVVALSPPVDLSDLFKNNVFLANIFAGGVPDVVGTARYDEASPKTYLANGKTPIMLLQGQRDNLVNYTTVDLFAEKLA